MTNGWYTVQEILDIIPEDDIIFVDGLSFTRKELEEEFNDIRLRYYRSETTTHTTHHMFTMCPAHI
jgi:hypothetical protein